MKNRLEGNFTSDVVGSDAQKVPPRVLRGPFEADATHLLLLLLHWSQSPSFKGLPQMGEWEKPSFLFTFFRQFACFNSKFIALFFKFVLESDLVPLRKITMISHNGIWEIPHAVNATHYTLRFSHDVKSAIRNVEVTKCYQNVQGDPSFHNFANLLRQFFCQHQPKHYARFQPIRYEFRIP